MISPDWLIHDSFLYQIFTLSAIDCIQKVLGKYRGILEQACFYVNESCRKLEGFLGLVILHDGSSCKDTCMFISLPVYAREKETNKMTYFPK